MAAREAFRVRQRAGLGWGEGAAAVAARWVALGGAAALLLLLHAGVAAAASRIVYVHGGRLNFITPGGATLGTTRKSGHSTTDIAASADGRRVAVLQNTGTDGSHGAYYRVFVRTAGSRKLQQIAVGGPIKRSGAPSLALSPHGRMLALSVGREIRLIDLETKHRRTLRKASGGFDVQPSFTSDGRHLVFCHSHWSSNRVDVYEIALRPGAHARRLIHSRAPEYFPDVSPDGRHLAFLRRDSSGFDLILSRRDGSRERVLRHVRYLAARPDFSPDGRRIAFAWVKYIGYAPFPPWTLFTIGIGGHGLRALTRGIRAGPLLPQWTRVP